MTISMSRIHRDYDCLEPVERFRAVTSALARGDAGERMALMSTCPKFSYWGTDQNFRLLILKAVDIGDAMLFDLMTRVLASTLLSEGEYDPDAEKLLDEAAAIWSGFGLFCEDVGTTADQFLSCSAVGAARQATQPGAPPLLSAAVWDYVIGMLRTVGEPEPEKVQHHREVFINAWRDAGPN